MVLSSQNARPRRYAPASEPGSLAERLSVRRRTQTGATLSGTLDMGLVHISVFGGRGMGLDNSRCPDACALPSCAAAAVGWDLQLKFRDSFLQEAIDNLLNNI